MFVYVCVVFGAFDYVFVSIWGPEIKLKLRS